MKIIIIKMIMIIKMMKTLIILKTACMMPISMWIFSSRERTRLADTVPDSPNKLSRFVVVMMTKMLTKKVVKMTRSMANGLIRIRERR